jgi:membrane protein required for colicin V production
MAAFCVLFVVTLVLAAVLNRIASAAVRKSSMSGTDRALGALFGLLRGVVIVVVLVWLAGFTKFPHGTEWKQSILVSYFEGAAQWMRSAVPPEWAAKLKYE